MTKRQNTILFIVLGTIFNILITLFLVILLTVAGALILREKIAYVMPVFLIAGIVLGVIIYQKAASFVIKKYNLEEKLDPLFSRKYKKK